MGGSRRDRQIGAGYDYQWDVALYWLLRFVVLGRDAAQAQITSALAQLGPITGIALEGDEPTKRLEDLTLYGGSGRELLVQNQGIRRGHDQECVATDRQEVSGLHGARCITAVQPRSTVLVPDQRHLP